MPWWRWLPGGERAVAPAQAVVLAHKLVGQGVDDAEAVAQLRAVPGGRQALAAAAGVTAPNVHEGYPYTRIYRLRRAAADEPLPEPTIEEAAIEARQRQLWEPPFD